MLESNEGVNTSLLELLCFLIKQLIWGSLEGTVESCLLILFFNLIKERASRCGNWTVNLAAFTLRQMLGPEGSGDTWGVGRGEAAPCRVLPPEPQRWGDLTSGGWGRVSTTRFYLKASARKSWGSCPGGWRSPPVE